MKFNHPFVYRGFASALVLAIAASVFCQGAADWKPSKMKPVELGKRVEKMFPTFKNVTCGVEFSYKAPDPGDPKGYGVGHALLGQFFWSPKAFRIQYLAFGKAEGGAWLLPSTEYLASDGRGAIRRLGSLVPAGMSNYTSKQKLFDVSSDAELVEAWPRNFSRYLFSPFVSGNATISRYLAALSRGVGGYKVRVQERTITVSDKKYKQHRVYAERPAKGKRVASVVEMIFDDSGWLPVTIHSTYGTKYDLNWAAAWRNNQKLPGDPFRIGAN